MKALLTILILSALAVPTNADAKRLTVHTKRLNAEQVQIQGRAPASASIRVTLRSLDGKFIAWIGYGTPGKRYSGFFSAPREAFRVIVTADTGDRVLRRTRRVAAGP